MHRQQRGVWWRTHRRLRPTPRWGGSLPPDGRRAQPRHPTTPRAPRALHQHVWSLAGATRASECLTHAPQFPLHLPQLQLAQLQHVVAARQVRVSMNAGCRGCTLISQHADATQNADSANNQVRVSMNAGCKGCTLISQHAGITQDAGSANGESATRRNFRFHSGPPHTQRQGSTPGTTTTTHHPTPTMLHAATGCAYMGAGNAAGRRVDRTHHRTTTSTTLPNTRQRSASGCTRHAQCRGSSAVCVGVHTGGCG